MKYLISVLLVVCSAHAETLNGRCLILNNLTEKTISLGQAKEALVKVNKMLRPMKHSVSCRWGYARFPTGDIAAYHYKQMTGNAMDYYRRLWGHRVLSNSSYDFVWVVSPEIPQLPGTRGTSPLCYKTYPEDERSLITYLSSEVQDSSITSLIGMHFGHLWGADTDDASFKDGEHSIMSHINPVGEWFSSKSVAQIRRCQTARINNNWF